MGNISLVLGGIKSGKTNYAETKAKEVEKSGGKILYLATAQALDDEMKSRIDRHKSSRPSSWTTVEETLNIKEVLQREGDSYDFILFDCLTLWITNRCIEAGEEYNRDELMASIIDECEEYISIVKDLRCDLLIVSNQVELGLISPYPLGRMFQDLAGLLHQKIGKYSKNVVVLTAGFPTALKGDI